MSYQSCVGLCDDACCLSNKNPVRNPTKFTGSANQTWVGPCLWTAVGKVIQHTPQKHSQRCWGICSRYHSTVFLAFLPFDWTGWHWVKTSQIASSPILLFLLGPREKSGSNVAAESPNLGGASQALILKRSCKGWMRNESHAKIVWGNRDFLSFSFGPLDCILERHNFGEPIIRWDWYGTAALTQLQSSMWIIHAAEGNWAMLLINWQFWASYAKSYLNDLKKMIREGYRIWNMQPETTAPLWTASF